MLDFWGIYLPTYSIYLCTVWGIAVIHIRGCLCYEHTVSSVFHINLWLQCTSEQQTRMSVLSFVTAWLLLLPPPPGKRSTPLLVCLIRVMGPFVSQPQEATQTHTLKASQHGSTTLLCLIHWYITNTNIKTWVHNTEKPPYLERGYRIKQNIARKLEFQSMAAAY